MPWGCQTLFQELHTKLTKYLFPNIDERFLFQEDGEPLVAGAEKKIDYHSQSNTVSDLKILHLYIKTRLFWMK